MGGGGWILMSIGRQNFFLICRPAPNTLCASLVTRISLGKRLVISASIDRRIIAATKCLIYALRKARKPSDCTGQHYIAT